MIIAIAGLIGAGKTTVAQDLAARLGYRVISGGDVFREMARERGISVTEVNKLAETDAALDRELDRRQAALANAGDCVVESRLSAWMVNADLRVWLRAPLEVRAARVARREGIPVEAATADLVERERSEWARYKASYGIDVDDMKPYHVVIDTTRWTAEAIIDALALLATTVRTGAPARPATGGRTGTETTR